jgi:hypothetical protein
MQYFITIGTQVVKSSRSSRTEVNTYMFFLSTVDRDQTVSRRSEPNSRITLIGEQPNPWQTMHHQDVMSRHRGAKQTHR